MLNIEARLPLREPLTDEQVVARVRAGDIGSFELLMRRYNQRVYRAVRAVLKDDAETQDVMQEAYVNAFTHLADFAGRAAFSTWLTRIAVHEACARRRRGRRFEPLEDAGIEAQMISSVPSPEDGASDVEVRLLLERAIEGLPEDFRTVFVLRKVEGLSVEDTAECLEIPEATVKTRLHRARSLLRAELVERVDAGVPTVFAFGLSRCDRLVARVLETLRATG